MINGLSVMRDEVTSSLWDHVSAECFEGPLEGKRLEFWYVALTDVGTELDLHPDAILLFSDQRSFISTVMAKIAAPFLSYRNKKALMLPHFRWTMHSEVDPRLPEGEQGLDLRDEHDRAKFYPLSLIPEGGAIEDEWLGKKVIITRNKSDGVAYAAWAEGGQPPKQLLTRWYGFSFTYPDCDIYSN